MWLRFYSCELCHGSNSSVIKAESGWVVNEEVDKAVDDYVDQSSVWVVTETLHYNVFLCLYVSRTAWAS